VDYVLRRVGQEGRSGSRPCLHLAPVTTRPGKYRTTT
jgi:hypothetical protein